MELFLAVLGLMDDTLLAALEAPVIGVLLTGYLVLALLGMFLALKDAAGGSSPGAGRRKK